MTKIITDNSKVNINLLEENELLKKQIKKLQLEKQELKKQLTIPVVRQQRELLPDFLYEDNGIIKVGVHGDSAVTDEWNDYLKKIR